MAPKSEIWRNFIKTDGSGKCKIFEKIIKTKNNTTNLHNHVKSIHGIIFDKKIKANSESKLLVDTSARDAYDLDDDDVEEVVPSSYLFSINNTSHLLMQLLVFQVTNEITINVDDAQNINPRTSCTQETVAVKKIPQPQITVVINNLKSFQEGRGKAGQINNSLVFIIIKDCLPFRTVEKDGFKSFMMVLCPLYKIPCRETIKNLVDNKYNAIATKVKNKNCQLK
ncbi:Protein of unknown function [Cotesia congregata]|uniref:Uncharacterized protein n=1 Tax=Cotesia congregata TaxID=51543 RepID=A0A8J2HM70_COTCN|nr:Protein of unknown function [Cotesia congregata]